MNEEVPMNTFASEAPCASCGYPLTAHYAEEIQNCPACGVANKSIGGVSVPDPIFWGSLGILGGLILSKSKWVRQQLDKI